MEMSNDALNLLWSLIGPQSTRCGFTGAEWAAVGELRAYVTAEAKRREAPGESPKG